MSKYLILNCFVAKKKNIEMKAFFMKHNEVRNNTQYKKKKDQVDNVPTSQCVIFIQSEGK